MQGGGAFRGTNGVDESLVIRFAGQVLAYGETYGITLFIGEFTLAIDAYGNFNGPFGNGKTVEICALIS